MHCNVVVDKEQYDEIVKAYMEQGKQLIALQNLYDSVTSERDSWKSAYSRVKDAYDEEAVKHREDYTELMSKYDKLKELKDEFCIEACNLSSALRARNALLQILFLATGIRDCMLKELFNCHFHTSEASFDADLTRRMIQHCINNNSTIIDTLTGFRFDIAARLAKAIKVRNVYGMPAHQARPKEAEGKEAKPNARCRRNKKKKDVRAKPEQSQRRAKRGKAKPHQKGK